MTRVARLAGSILAATALVAGGLAAAAALASASSLADVKAMTVTDKEGDNPSGAPDVVKVVISNDDAGVLTVQVTLANRAQLDDGDYVRVFLNTDLDVDTGCGTDAGLGAEVSMFVNGHTSVPDFFGWIRCTNGAYDLTTPDASFAGSFDAATRTVTFRLDRADFGSPDAVLVWTFGVLQPNATDVYLDLAPDAAAIGYEIVVPPVFTRTTTDTVRSTQTQTTTVVVPAIDVAPPRVRAVGALRESLHRGGLAKLRYRVSDDSGKTREEVRVYGRGNRVLGVQRLPLAPTDPAKVYFSTWRVPVGDASPLRYCVRAWDAAGNAAAPSCAALRLASA